jgi:hypothetical protein
VWDSKLYPEERTPFYWVDDNTLLFRAGAGSKPRNLEEKSLRKEYLYLWRLGEAPKPYGADPVAASVAYCADSGVVSYRQHRTDPSTGRRTEYVMKGPLGQEIEQPLPAGVDPLTRPSADWNRIERGNCDLYGDVRMRDRTWVTDSERQYRIDFGPKRGGREPHPVALMRADGSGRVELPVRSTEVLPLCTHFHRFDGAFLIWNCIGAPANPESRELWRQTNCWAVWRIEPPDGRTQKICIPHGPWALLFGLIPTKIGLLFKAVAATPKGQLDLKASGLYVLRDGTAQRILAGIIDDPAVSPSGCKVVMAYSPNADASRLGAPGSPSIIATDLCSTK